jgi:3-methyladenine DNA glycosylase AlkD/predicted nucleotidyltransferase
MSVDLAPRMRATIQAFLDQVVCWAGERADLRAVLLVGSYARNAATGASDIDLVLLADEPGNYLADTSWINRFGQPVRQQVEDYGRLTSLRLWYRDGREVEYGLTAPDWASQPLDEGSDRVIMDGAKVLYEREQLVSPLVEGFHQAEELYAALVQAIRRRANPAFAAQNRAWHKNTDFQSYGLKAAEHREVSRLFRREIGQLSLRGQLHLARWLALAGFAEEANFANAVLAEAVKALSPADFAYLDEHLEHLHGWRQVDDFCIHVMQPLLWKYPVQTLARLQKWNRSENLLKRRASVVVFARKVGASGRFTDQALALCEPLLGDREDLVQKGTGWALKDVMRGDKERVLAYVQALRRRGVQATITLYAIRHLKGAERRAVLAIHPAEDKPEHG